jgi:hypothetical protein
VNFEKRGLLGVEKQELWHLYFSFLPIRAGFQLANGIQALYTTYYLLPMMAQSNYGILEARYLFIHCRHTKIRF